MFNFLILSNFLREAVFKAEKNPKSLPYLRWWFLQHQLTASDHKSLNNVTNHKNLNFTYSRVPTYDSEKFFLKTSCNVLIQIFGWTEDFHIWLLNLICTFIWIPCSMEYSYKRLQNNSMILVLLVYNHIKISGKKLWRVNYHSAGKKLAEVLKVLLSRPWS